MYCAGTLEFQSCQQLRLLGTMREKSMGSKWLTLKKELSILESELELPKDPIHKIPHATYKFFPTDFCFQARTRVAVLHVGGATLSSAL